METWDLSVHTDYVVYMLYIGTRASVLGWTADDG